MSKTNNVQEVFGKFAVEVNGAIKLFDNEAEAITADVLATREAEFVSKAVAYTDSIETTSDKQAKQIQNVVVAYLAHEATTDTEADDTEADSLADGTEF